MGEARAGVEVDAPVAEAERLWYDLSRWPGFVDGFRHLAKRDGDWPREGRIIWESAPDGRGRVVERVVRHEPGAGQTAEVEDPRLTGTQSIAFAAVGEDRCRVTLTLDYRLKRGGPLAAIVDGLFVGRAVRDALHRTLVRFARELESDRELGA